MTAGDVHPALDRIVGRRGGRDAFTLLAEELPGADLTTLMLEVARRRVSRRTAADVLVGYRNDRFVAPGTLDAVAMARLTVDALESARPDFDPVAVAPVAPFGAHHVLGGVDQNNVVTTLRGSELTADPSTSLALEAAVRRADLQRDHPKTAETVRLSTVAVVTRAQRFAGSRSFANFTLFCLVSAGRDRGNRDFERDALIEHITALGDLVARWCEGRVIVRLSEFDGRFGDVLEAVASGVHSDRVSCELWPERGAGRGYYPNACFKLEVDTGDERIELGDGGMVDWTAALLQNRKERLMTCGLSLERLAMLR